MGGHTPGAPPLDPPMEISNGVRMNFEPRTTHQYYYLLLAKEMTGILSNIMEISLKISMMDMKVTTTLEPHGWPADITVRKTSI